MCSERSWNVSCSLMAMMITAAASVDRCTFCYQRGIWPVVRTKGILVNEYIPVDSSVGFPGGSDGEESACNAGDLGLIPGSGRCPGEGNGNPLQYSCLEKPLDRGVWQVQSMGLQRDGWD